MVFTGTAAQAAAQKNFRKYNIKYVLLIYVNFEQNSDGFSIFYHDIKNEN
jgi:hypothetical protein